MTWKDLISEAELSFFFVNGQGLGSFLLALVLIAFIFRQTREDTFLKQVAKHFLGWIGGKTELSDE